MGFCSDPDKPPSWVKIRSVSPNPQKIATKHFFALTALMGHAEPQKKSPGSSDPGNRVNLHIFKMAAIENFVGSSIAYRRHASADFYA